MIQIYCGDGKGKTTAAFGAALRAAGNGLPVCICQFLKDGSSGEVRAISGIQGVRVMTAPHHFGFYKDMTDEERQTAAEEADALFDQAMEWLTDACGDGQKQPNQVEAVLVLDEVIGALSHRMLAEKKVLDVLDGLPLWAEVILTGRTPSEALMNRADYLTFMQKERHPFDKGVMARAGIEK